MSHLRFSRDEYRTICKLCKQLRLDELSPLTVTTYLSTCLSERSPELASKLGKLNSREACILYDHLKSQRLGQAKPATFTKNELQAITVACEAFPLTSRFLHHLRRWLVPLLHQVFPALAKKVSGMRDRQLVKLHEYIRTRRKETRE
jgi:hypothetical protein